MIRVELGSQERLPRPTALHEPGLPSFKLPPINVFLAMLRLPELRWSPATAVF